MTIVTATSAYERWARRRIGLIGADIVVKHRRMHDAAFPFLRATFYRWCELYHDACPHLAAAPKLLAVGDLHIENFGTWRDAEGRLIWGINDFDEASPMPYTVDLVRLATSALLAKREHRLSIGARQATAAILKGYRATIERGDGRPFVLEENNPELRAMAMGEERDPVRFWAKLTGFRAVSPPRPVRAMIARRLPEENGAPRYVHRIAGLGSLGRARYVGIAQSDGGLVAREAKPTLPPVYGGLRADAETYYTAIIARAVRAPDPFVAVEQGWLLRRLAPHCTRIELTELPKRQDERLLLEAMGAETANVHLGSREALAALRRDLKKRGTNWLYHAAAAMAEATLKDWKDWRAS
ncbi:MAG TPA: DUF2252 family protein [Stellaceae bacterium]|jgi:hypothetical protein